MPFCIEMPEIMIAWSCVWSTFSSWGCLNCTHNSTSFKPCELEINFKEKHILYICWKTLEVQLDLILHFVHHHHHPHRHRHHHHHHHHRCHHHTHLKWQQCYQEIETVMERPMRRCMLLCKKMPAMPMIRRIKWWKWYSRRVGWCLDDDWMIIGWLIDYWRMQLTEGSDRQAFAVVRSETVVACKIIILLIIIVFRYRHHHNPCRDHHHWPTIRSGRVSAPPKSVDVQELLVGVFMQEPTTSTSA